MAYVIGYLIAGCLLVMLARHKARRNGTYDAFIQGMACNEKPMLLSAMVFWLPMLAVAFVIKLIRKLK